MDHHRAITNLIRPACIDDLPRIMEIESHCFDEGVRESEETYAQRISVFTEGFLVIDAPEGISGFITSEIWPRQTGIAKAAFALGHPIAERFDPAGTDFYVSSLAVDPAYRGKAFGPLLFDALLDSIPKAYPRLDRVLLLVAENWLAARAIYERRGFSELRRFPGFFGRGAHETDRGDAYSRADYPVTDGIVMGKNLS